MKLGLMTLWTNGRQEAPLAPGRPRSTVRATSKGLTDVLAPSAKPLFALDAEPLEPALPTEAHRASADATFDLEPLPVPPKTLPLPRKTKGGQRARKRAPRSTRGRTA